MKGDDQRPTAARLLYNLRIVSCLLGNTVHLQAQRVHLTALQLNYALQLSFLYNIRPQHFAKQ